MGDMERLGRVMVGYNIACRRCSLVGGLTHMVMDILTALGLLKYIDKL